MDKIIIRKLRLDAIIGVNPEERTRRQKLLAHVELDMDLSKAAASDDINDTLDYKALKNKLIDTAGGTDFKLLEALAVKLVSACLEDQRVSAVRLILDKPGALRYADSAAIEILRTRKNMLRIEKQPT